VAEQAKAGAWKGMKCSRLVDMKPWPSASLAAVVSGGRRADLELWR